MSIFFLIDLHRSGLEYFLSTFIVLLVLSSIWVLVAQYEKFNGSLFKKTVNRSGIFGSIGLLIFTVYLLIAAHMQNPYSMEVEIATCTIVLAFFNLLTLSVRWQKVILSTRTLLVFLGNLLIFVLAFFQMIYEFPRGSQSIILLVACMLTAAVALNIIRRHSKLKKIFIAILVLFSICLVLFGLWRKIIPRNCPCDVDVAICTVNYQAFGDIGKNFVKLLMFQPVDNYKVSGCHFL